MSGKSGGLSQHCHRDVPGGEGFVGGNDFFDAMRRAAWIMLWAHDVVAKPGNRFSSDMMCGGAADDLSAVVRRVPIVMIFRDMRFVLFILVGRRCVGIGFHRSLYSCPGRQFRWR